MDKFILRLSALFLVVVFATKTTYSQTYLMSNSTINTCSGTFYDPQGTSDYLENQNRTMTFCSDNGDNIRFDFTSFGMQSTWDWLDVYDGPNTSSTKIARYSSSVPSSVISTGTCLTFVFNSDGWVNNTGWEAEISCFDPGACGSYPVAEDLCANAPMLSGFDGICGSTTGFTATDLTGTNLQSEFCTGVNWINSNSWLQFVADETTVELAVLLNCPGAGLEMAVFETSDCITFTQIDCYQTFYNWAPGVFEINGLTVGNTYYLMMDGQNANNCDFQINGLSGVSLPIKLSSFDGQCNGGLVEINWTTSSEINNDFFTVEKSTDGIEYSVLGVVDGAGNSNTNINYQLVDTDPLANTCYYRLKQTDFDGTFEYSQPVSVSCSQEENDFSIYPNPVDEVLTIYFSRQAERDFTYEITDCTGRKLMKGELISGNSRYVIQLDNQISAGMYVISIYNEQEKISKTIIKN